MAATKAAWSEAEKTTIVGRVLAAMAEGETVEASVKAMGLELTPGAVRRWMLTGESWAVEYQRAKLMLGQAMAEEAVRVARESTRSSAAEDRVLIETLKWAAGKANPAEFGDRQTVEHAGSQTLSVRIVEENVPLRLPVRQALESGVLALSGALTVPVIGSVSAEE